VANCEDAGLVANEAVRDHMATAAKVDQPFPKFGTHIFDWPLDVWLNAQGS